MRRVINKNFFNTLTKKVFGIIGLPLSLVITGALVAQNSLQTFRKNSSKFTTSSLSKQAQKVLRLTETRETSELLNKHFWVWFWMRVVNKYFGNSKSEGKLKPNSENDKRVEKVKSFLNENGERLKKGDSSFEETLKRLEQSKKALAKSKKMLEDLQRRSKMENSERKG